MIKEIFQRIVRLVKTPVYYHPILIGVSYFLNLLILFYNSGSFPSFIIIASLLVFCILIPLIAIISLSIIFTNLSKIAILASLVVFSFFYYNFFGAIFSIFGMSPEPISPFEAPANFLALSLCIVTIIISSVLLKKTKLHLYKTNKYLITIIIVLTVYNFKNIEINKDPKITLNENIKLDEKYIGMVSKPDIYYIILDAHASMKSLQKYWNYKDTTLTNYLSKQKFFLAEDSKSDYASTIYCMTSYFNMSRIDYDPAYFDTEEQTVSVYESLRKNPFINYLHKIKYTIENISNFDLYESNSKTEVSPLFMLSYFRKTFLNSLWWEIRFNYKQNYKRNLNIFQRIIEIAKRDDESPKFVYAHIMMPHPPYYFSRDGSIVQDKKILMDFKNKEAYLEQLIYTDKILINTIDSIFIYSKRKPVIIVQGDHGARVLNNNFHDEEAHSILNTYYFPDNDYSLLKKDINPLNSFRVILSKYFDNNLPIID